MPTATVTPIRARIDESLGVVRDLEQYAAELDERLRGQLTPEQYWMMRDLQLTTRAISVAREAADM